jgi:hypothetical protein
MNTGIQSPESTTTPNGQPSNTSKDRSASGLNPTISPNLTSIVFITSAVVTSVASIASDVISRNTTNPTKALSVGARVGIILGGLAILSVLFACLSLYLRIRRRRISQTSLQDEDASPYTISLPSSDVVHDKGGLRFEQITHSTVHGDAGLSVTMPRSPDDDTNRAQDVESPSGSPPVRNAYGDVDVRHELQELRTQFRQLEARQGWISVNGDVVGAPPPDYYSSARDGED